MRKLLAAILLAGIFQTACQRETPVAHSVSSSSDEEDEENEILKIVVRPSYLSLQEGGEPYELAALVAYQPSEPVPLTESVSWSSDNPLVATVNQDGLVTPEGAGITYIRAEAGGVRGATYLVVREVATEEVNEPEEAVMNPPPSGEPIACDNLPEGADPFADRVVSFEPGPGVPATQDTDLALGPPYGGGCCQGGMDVVRLGRGEIVLELTDFHLCNGDGLDLIIFENPFFHSFDDEGNPLLSFAEPGIVGLSQDGETFFEFSCDLDEWPYNGCAGVFPVYANPLINDIDPTDPVTAGGDAFDLSDIGLDWARFVRIRDAGLTATLVNGFDLDAITVVNGKNP